MQFTLEDISDDEIARRRAIYEPLTDSVRQLIDAVIRTEVPDDVVAAARERIDAIVDTLRAEQIDGPYGVRYTPDFVGMPWGNSVVGVRNASRLRCGPATTGTRCPPSSPSVPPMRDPVVMCTAEWPR